MHVACIPNQIILLDHLWMLLPHFIACAGWQHERLSPSVLLSCNMGPHGYKYIEDLLRLESERPTVPARALLDAYTTISTPMIRQEWKRCLTSYPDQCLVSYLLQGFKAGF